MEIRVFDLPEYIDRYTLVIEREEGNREFYAMSENPTDSLGVNMFCGTTLDGYIEGPHLGKQLYGIPECICSAVERRI